MKPPKLEPPKWVPVPPIAPELLEHLKRCAQFFNGTGGFNHEGK